MKALGFFNLPVIIFLISWLFLFVNCDSDEVSPEFPVFETLPDLRITSTWKKSAGMDSLSINKILEVEDKLISLTLDSGIYESTTNGISWVKTNDGVSRTAFSARDISVGKEYMYVIVSGDNIYYSKDNGIFWEATDYNKYDPYVSSTFNLIVIDDSIICVSAGSGRFRFERSTDFGKTWTESFPGNDNWYRNYKLFNDTLYAATATDGIRRSIDKGLNWTNIGLDGVNLHDYFVTPDMIIAATSDGIYKSIDRGLTWTGANMYGLGTDKLEIASFTVEGDWVFSYSYEEKIFISKIHELKLANWESITLEGLPKFDDHNLFIRGFEYAQGYLLLGITDVRTLGAPNSAHGRGTWYLEIPLQF